MGDRQSAVNFYNQAVKALNDQNNPDRLKLAYQLFGSASMADPTWYEAHYQSGNNNSELNLLNASVACWRRGLECEMKPEERAKLLANMGWRLHGLGYTQEAHDASYEAVRLDPNLAYAWINLSCIHGIMDQAMTSVECARQAYTLKPDDPLIQMQLAFSLLFNRDLVEGFKFLECRFAYRLKSYLQFPYPKWDGTPNKTIYLDADQGLGDTLSYARFVEAACERSQYVHALIQPELMRLFSHAFMHIKNLNLIPKPCPFMAADAWTTFVSLPNTLALTDSEIRNAPDIALPRMVLPINWKVPDRKFHIGIAWAGSPLNDIDRHRNIPVTQFFELYRVPGVQLYSLQVGERYKDIHDVGGAPVVRDLVPYIRDVVDTLAVMQSLDLVICVESALGHICAMAGKECWIPYSHMGKDYRLGYRGKDRLWSPKHRIFLQGEDRDWGPVFREIVAALEEKVHGADRTAGSQDQRARPARATVA